MDDILDILNPRELGTELKRAREGRGLTQQAAADVLQVARTTITAIENGERRIKATELVKLSRAYGRLVSEFVRRERPKGEPFQLQFRSAYRRLENSQQIAEESVLELEILSRNYVELERITDSPLSYNYPDEKQYVVVGSRIDQIAESIAAQERNRLGLGDGPVSMLRDALEREVGLRVFYIPIEPYMYSAMYAFDPEMGGCIAVHSGHPVERQRWSLAHEYAHFLVHRHHPDMVGEVYQRLPERERFADAFAGYFLMPTASVVRQIGAKSINRTDLFIMAHYFGVSVEALTRRLEALRIVPVGTWEDMRSRGVKVRQIQTQLGLEQHSPKDTRVPLRYLYLAASALGDGLISEGQFTDYMRVSRMEARGIIESLRDASGDGLDLTKLIDSGKA